MSEVSNNCQIISDYTQKFKILNSNSPAPLLFNDDNHDDHDNNSDDDDDHGDDDDDKSEKDVGEVGEREWTDQWPGLKVTKQQAQVRDNDDANDDDDGDDEVGDGNDGYHDGDHDDDHDKLENETGLEFKILPSLQVVE